MRTCANSENKRTGILGQEGSAGTRATPGSICSDESDSKLGKEFSLDAMNFPEELSYP